MNSNSDLLLALYHFSRAMAKLTTFLVKATGYAVFFCFGLVCGLIGIDLPAPETATQAPRKTHRAPRPTPAARTYNVVCDRDNEVTLNGVPIGHIDSAPWQFCSYDLEYGNGPARPSRERAMDDATDYAEAVAKGVTL